jgi:hypothetical protein
MPLRHPTGSMSLGSRRVIPAIEDHRCQRSTWSGPSESSTGWKNDPWASLTGRLHGVTSHPGTSEVPERAPIRDSDPSSNPARPTQLGRDTLIVLHEKGLIDELRLDLDAEVCEPETGHGDG